MANQNPKQRVVTKKHIARLERERRQVRLIRLIALGAIGFVGLLLAYGYVNLNYLQLQKPVAEINGEVITVGEWQERLQIQRINLLNQYNYLQFQQNFGFDTSQQQQQVLTALQTPELLGQQVLDQMVDDVLIRQEAEKRGITVSDEEVEDAIRASYEFFPDGTPTPTITPTEFSFPTLTSRQLTLVPPTEIPTEAPTSTTVPTLTPDPAITPTSTATQSPATPTFVPEPPTATATPYTLDGYTTRFGESLTMFKENGVSEKTVRAVYASNLLREKLQEDMGKDVPATEEQVWARHILAPDDQTLGIVRSLLIAGWDFADVAKKYSADTGSGANGGDLGWFGRGAMVAEFENASFSQEIGVIGEPVQTQFGFHIIQVLGRADIPLTASQLQQKRELALGEWLIATRAESEITISEIWKDNIPDLPPAFTQQ